MIRHQVRMVLVVASLLMPACAPAQSAHPAAVRPGIDVLLSDSLALVRGRRVGLVTNQTGIDARGVPDAERLRGAGVELVALFSPEHGFRGAAAPGAPVGSSRDSLTGLPIYSLYGKTIAPTAEMLRGIDLMLVDLQDVGARYYTYISTTIEVMKAAGAAGIPVVVLDRPNPIGGPMQGNVLDPRYSTFVGALAVPMRHGLTLGELARLAVMDRGLRVTLHVVPASGWRRADYFEATGLPFIAPSQNLRSLEAIVHYPGTCLFEGTNLSVGRGTAEAFAQVGAPWLDPARVLERLGPVPGVSIEPVSFTPSRPGDGKYADTLVQGLRLRVLDRGAYDPTGTAVHLLAAVKAVHPDQFEFLEAHFDRLAGAPTLRLELERGTPPARIVDAWAAPRAAFRARLSALLLYPE